jgi:SAM-dependent methyltransferase
VTQPKPGISAPPTYEDLIELLRPISHEYSPKLDVNTLGRSWHESLLARFAFDMKLVIDALGTDITVVDLAGGVGLFSIGFAMLGARSVIIDDWGDETHLFDRGHLFEMFSRYGVETIERDVLNEPLGLPEGTFDAATSFHFLEHAYRSPKPAFHQLKAALKPGGMLVVAGPNCVNLRKRVMAPLGHYPWTRMEEWYDSERFRGHVREPSVRDLDYIARDLGMSAWEIRGANFLGRAHSGVKGRLAERFDAVLRHRPSLCSDIYLVARA